MTTQQQKEEKKLCKHGQDEWHLCGCEIETQGKYHLDTCRSDCKISFAPLSHKTWEEDEGRPDINKIKCSCGQYYFLLDHKCYPFVEEFDKQFSHFFPGTVEKIAKEKMKTFIHSLIAEAERKVLEDLVTEKTKMPPTYDMHVKRLFVQYVSDYATSKGISLTDTKE